MGGCSDDDPRLRRADTRGGPTFKGNCQDSRIRIRAVVRLIAAQPADRIYDAVTHRESGTQPKLARRDCKPHEVRIDVQSAIDRTETDCHI